MVVKTGALAPEQTNNYHDYYDLFELYLWDDNLYNSSYSIMHVF